MTGGWRTSMAWLHTWSGLVTGWLLLVVCITGSAAYYRDEITLWMQPELHAASLQAEPQQAAAQRAVAVLQQRAPDAASWIIDLPLARKPYTEISWSSERGARPRPGAARPGGLFESATLDSSTGAVLPAARDSDGGNFFYAFHFTLHYMPARWGRWLVSICTMVMLVAIVSGVITHRRFFADFFTFRPGKGQRSWLDAHNALGVLALPYHLMICYSGLVALMFLTMPWALSALYGENKGAFFASALPQAPPLLAPAGTAAPMRDIGSVLAAAGTAWHGAPVTRITVQRPNDAAARYVVQRHEEGRLSLQRQSLTYGAVDGQLLAVEGAAPSAAAETRNTMVGLHLARFATPWLRALLFVCGQACCAMIATGLLLWTVKAAQRKVRPPGLRLAQGLNLACIAGLPAAMAVFFWLNRLLPAQQAGRATQEVDGFFMAWGVLTLLALLWPSRRMWRWQLGLGALLFAALPLLNLLTAPPGSHAALLLGGDGLVAATDAGLLAIGLLLAWAGWRLRQPQRSAAGARGSNHAQVRP